MKSDLGREIEAIIVGVLVASAVMLLFFPRPLPRPISTPPELIIQHDTIWLSPITDSVNWACERAIDPEIFLCSLQIGAR